MEHLNSINIRSGIEIDIPVSEIFNLSLAPKGNHHIKELWVNGTSSLLVNSKLEDSIDKEHFVKYEDNKTYHKINDSMYALVFDSYIAYRHSDTDIIKCDKNIDIEFVNTKILDLDSYCANLMIAQEFSGQWKTPIFLYYFLGVGSFSFEDYIGVHPMVANSNCNMLQFYIYFKKIMTSIDGLLHASYENDIKSQKKYLTDKEFKSLIRMVKKQRRYIRAQFELENLANLNQQIDEDEANDDE